jgi:serine/threonine protein kinase
MSQPGATSPPEPPFHPFILGRFHVVAPLGSGGMARVFLAEYRGVGGFSRRVVIKQIHEQHATSERFVKMFVDEANIAARLTHPNVIQVLDLQQDGPNLYMVLEYVDGLDLNTLFNHLAGQNTRLPVMVALHVVNQVLAGLAHAHRATGTDGQPLALIHRDITPGNVLLGRQGQVKLSDFGVARAANRMTQTVVGEVKGKYSYMAPEVMQGDPYDQRSDVFGAGVVLWEALTTRPLFRGKSDFHVMEQVLRGQLYPPSAYNPDVPPELDAVVMRALERPVAARWPSARDLKRALSPFVRGVDPDVPQDMLTDLVQQFSPPLATPAAPRPSLTPAQPLPAVPPPSAAAPTPPAPPASPTPAPPAPPPAAAGPTPPLPANTPAPPIRSRSLPPMALPADATLPDVWAQESLPPTDADLSWVQAVIPGEPAFFAQVGPARKTVGPMGSTSAFHLLQNRDTTTVDRVGCTASALMPVPEAGRLLMLDHLVKPPAVSGAPALQGNLREGKAVKVLLALGAQRASGVLVLHSTQTLQAYLQEGALQYSFLPDPTHHLLSLFVHHQPNGRALLPTLLQAVLRDRLSLPRVMAKVAQLSGSRITAAVSALARERLLHALKDDNATYAFHPGVAAPYDLAPSKDVVLALVPLLVSRQGQPQDLAAYAARLLDRPLEMEPVDDRVAADLGMAREMELLRTVNGGTQPLRTVWGRLVRPGSPEEQRLLMALVTLSRCGLLNDRLPAVMVNLP